LPDPIITILISAISIIVSKSSQNNYIWLPYNPVLIPVVSLRLLKKVPLYMKLLQRLGFKYIQTKIKLIALGTKKGAAKYAFKLFCTPFGKAKLKQKPADATALQFILDGKKINGYRWNYPQPKKALILHGFSSNALRFEHYVAPLMAKGYEVLAFDAPAHGTSDGKTTHALEYSSMIKKVEELYGPINSYIAHSFGGLALSLAIEAMPHSQQTKIVFIAPATETSSAIDGALAILKVKDNALRKEMDNLVVELSGHTTEWFSVRRAVNNITAQILWLHDEDDDVTPLSDALKVKTDNHQNINFVITKGLGHRKIYHDEAAKKAIINFI
jgi:pimeloyl-ACP methyl ester carboxylesterase